MLHAAVYTPSTVPDPKRQGQGYYVADPDSLLPDSTIQWLNNCARRLDAATQVEMATVALGSIGEMDAFDFAYELFQRWGIGGKGRNTGVLILFVMESHDIRIMTGTGIEGVLTDAKCSQIIHNDMIPAFKSGHYGDGLCLGALSIYEICTNGETPEELLTIRSVTNRGKYANGDSGLSTEDKAERWGWGIAGAFFAFIILVLIVGSIPKKCPKCLKRKAKRTRSETLVAATYSHGGQEKNTYTCAACGYTFTVIETTPRLRDTSDSDSGGSYSSGGGGGSWGGGSTSGGGAGGKW